METTTRAKDNCQESGPDRPKHGNSHVLGGENRGRAATGASNYTLHFGEVLLQHAVPIKGTSVDGGETKIKDKEDQSIRTGRFGV